MPSTDFLHAANTIVGILGVASANPAVAAAASGLSAAFSMQEIWRRITGQTDTIADRIALDLTEELARHHLPAQTRLLIPQMIAKAVLSPAQIMAAARKPDQICVIMLAQMEDPAHKTTKARDGFQRVVTALLSRHLADPDTGDALRPAFDDAIAAALQHIGQQVEYLVARARDDAHRLGVQEGMLISLARRYAPDDPANADAALKSLEVALETAARMKAREITAQNSGAETDSVIAEVNRLNALDQMAEADALIATAQRDIDAKAAEIDAQRALLHTLGLDQARLLAAPDRAAEIILAELIRQAPASGLFRALHDTWEEWFDRGHDKGVAFDLSVALHLARANLDRSKGVQRLQAMADLGITQFRLGEMEGRDDRLKQSLATWRTFLEGTPRKRDHENWALGMNNHAMVLQTFGKREVGTARLLEAVDAFGKVLTVYKRDRVPLDWAASWGNMGEALSLIADRTDDLAMARQALQQLEEAEAVLRGGGHETFATYSADRIPRAKAVIARLSQVGVQA